METLNASFFDCNGTRLPLRRKKTLFPFGKEEGRLEASVIEGNEIFLENTKADFVRGRFIHIGSGCEIKHVEYEKNY